MVIWVGMIVFFTFFAAPSIFKALPRELAGEVIGHIFPKYWANRLRHERGIYRHRPLSIELCKIFPDLKGARYLW